MKGGILGLAIFTCALLWGGEVSAQQTNIAVPSDSVRSKIYNRNPFQKNQKKVDFFGVDMLFYDLGVYDPQKKDQAVNWYAPGREVKNMVGYYHLNPNLVKEQFKNMKRSGLDTVVLQVHNSSLIDCFSAGSCNNGFDDWVWGELIDSGLGKLRPQHDKNLRDLLRLARGLGFRMVIVRLADYGASGYGTKEKWNEEKYQKSMAFVRNVKKTLDEELTSPLSPTDYLLDLGVEATGHPSMGEYVRRMWKDYCTEFGPEKSFGFSTIPDAFHVSALTWEQGCRPKYYAFDVYGDTPGMKNEDDRDMVAQISALDRQLKMMNKGIDTIFITETFFADAKSAKEFRTYLDSQNSLDIKGIMFWQRERLDKSSLNPHISVDPIKNLHLLTDILGPYKKEGVAQMFVLDQVQSQNSIRKCQAFFEPCSLHVSLRPFEKLFVRLSSGGEEKTHYLACATKKQNVQISGLPKNSSMIFMIGAGSDCQSAQVTSLTQTAKVFVRQNDMGPAQDNKSPSWHVKSADVFLGRKEPVKKSGVQPMLGQTSGVFLAPAEKMQAVQKEAVQDKYNSCAPKSFVELVACTKSNTTIVLTSDIIFPRGGSWFINGAENLVLQNPNNKVFVSGGAGVSIFVRGGRNISFENVIMKANSIFGVGVHAERVENLSLIGSSFTGYRVPLYVDEKSSVTLIGNKFLGGMNIVRGQVLISRGNTPV